MNTNLFNLATYLPKTKSQNYKALRIRKNITLSPFKHSRQLSPINNAKISKHSPKHSPSREELFDSSFRKNTASSTIKVVHTYARPRRLVATRKVRFNELVEKPVLERMSPENRQMYYRFDQYKSRSPELPRMRRGFSGCKFIESNSTQLNPLRPLFQFQGRRDMSSGLRMYSEASEVKYKYQLAESAQ